ncbi:MAG: hypothetical protein ABIP21_13730, partial [Acidimicrobiia bacterium]
RGALDNVTDVISARAKLDVHERKSWDAYQDAYEDMVRNTSTKASPWYVVPADHKWFARLVIAEALAATLLDIDPRFPTMSPEQLSDLAAARAALEAD